MNHSKVFSVRFEDRTIHLLDDFLSKHPYWSRNSVMEKIVVAVLEGADRSGHQTILNHYKYGNKKLKVTITEVPKDDEASRM